MIYEQITKALETHLSNMSGVPPIARQNAIYSPTTDTTFLRSENIPTLRRRRTLGPTPWQRYEGLYRITVCSKEGVGVGENFNLVDQVLTQFDSSTDLYYDNVTDILYTEALYEILLEDGDPVILNRLVYITVDYSEAGTPYTDSPFFCTPVNVHYYSYWRNA